MIKFEGVRPADDAFFEKGDILQWKKLNHTPIIAIIEHKGVVTIRVIQVVSEALELPDNTKLMCQWRGQYNSDYFSFTVEDLRLAKIIKDVNKKM